jgi:uncharacterized protein
MKLQKILWVFVFLLSGFIVTAQQEWPKGEAGKDYNVKDARGRQGLWIRVFADKPDVIYYKGQFKDDVPVGVWEWYYKDGHLMTLMTHLEGDKVTDNVSFYADGKTKMSEGRFVKKNVQGRTVRCREGEWKFYNESGSMMAQENYQDSLRNGVCKYFRVTGALLKLVNYKEGQKDGPFIEYHENGKKMREGTYLRDDFEGAFMMWHDNGMKEVEGFYLKGQQDGTWTYYKSSGAIEMRVLYKMGVEKKRQFMEGSQMEYYTSGLPKCEYTWEEGRKNGPFKEWYDQGQFVKVPTDKADQELGIMFREKLEGQVLAREGDYLNDKLEGEVICYDPSGKVDKIEVYSEGVLKSTKTP